jgi:hypothetical protein
MHIHTYISFGETSRDALEPATKKSIAHFDGDSTALLACYRMLDGRRGRGGFKSNEQQQQA